MVGFTLLSSSVVFLRSNELFNVQVLSDLHIPLTSKCLQNNPISCALDFV